MCYPLAVCVNYAGFVGIFSFKQIIGGFVMFNVNIKKTVVLLLGLLISGAAFSMQNVCRNNVQVNSVSALVSEAERLICKEQEFGEAKKNIQQCFCSCPNFPRKDFLLHKIITSVGTKSSGERIDSKVREGLKLIWCLLKNAKVNVNAREPKRNGQTKQRTPLLVLSRNIEGTSEKEYNLNARRIALDDARYILKMLLIYGADLSAKDISKGLRTFNSLYYLATAVLQLLKKLGQPNSNIEAIKKRFALLEEVFSVKKPEANNLEEAVISSSVMGILLAIKKEIASNNEINMQNNFPCLFKYLNDSF